MALLESQFFQVGVEMNIIELALAKKILLTKNIEEKNKLKIIHKIYKYKELNEIELFEFTRIELKKIYQIIQKLQQNKTITKNKNGKYTINNTLETINKTIEEKEIIKLMN